MNLTRDTLYNRAYSFNFTGPFVKAATDNIAVVPFLRSMDAVTRGLGFNYYNISSVVLVNGSNAVQLWAFLNYSTVSTVCVTVLYYHQTRAALNPLNYNSSWAWQLPMASDSPSLTLASVSSNNFSIPSIYGPSFSPKCVVGLNLLKWQTSLRQTMNFNMSGTGIFNLISSSYYTL
jgi:hypothetical protein